MAQNYIQLVNRVLRRFNEVQLTNLNFNTANGFQQQVQDAINDAHNDIYVAELNWPFLYQNAIQVTTPGLQTYALPATYAQIDWNNFFIKRDDTQIPPVTASNLNFMDYYEWLQTYAPSDAQMPSTVWSKPISVFMYPDRVNFGVSPVPGPGATSALPAAVYNIAFSFWSRPIDLAAATDTTVIPDRYAHVIIDGAMYYGYMFRDNPDEAAIAQNKFRAGINFMRTELINKPDYMRSDSLDHGQVISPGFV